MAGSSHNLSGYHDRYTIHFTGIIRYPQLFHPTEERERGETDVSYRGILFGAWLVIMPEFFVNILMYLLGALLVIAGVQQLVSLISARKWSNVPLGFYLMPALILITGVMILAYPFGAAANTFVIFGVASIFYGACELINWYKFRKRIENTGL